MDKFVEELGRNVIAKEEIISYMPNRVTRKSGYSVSSNMSFLVCLGASGEITLYISKSEAIDHPHGCFKIFGRWLVFVAELEILLSRPAIVTVSDSIPLTPLIPLEDSDRAP